MNKYEKEKAWNAYQSSIFPFIELITFSASVILIIVIIYLSQTGKGNTVTFIGLGVGLFVALSLRIYLATKAPEDPIIVSSNSIFDSHYEWRDD